MFGSNLYIVESRDINYNEILRLHGGLWTNELLFMCVNMKLDSLRKYNKITDREYKKVLNNLKKNLE